MRFSVMLLAFLALPGRAEVCGDSPAREARFEAGLALETLIPSRLPDFASSMPSYGVVAAIPWGPNAIELEVLYGSTPTNTVRLVEAAYRLSLDTPHLNGFALGGAHFLSYRGLGPTYSFVGGFLGLGATISMAKRFSIDMLLKNYFQTRPMLAVGGSFRLAL